MYGTGINYPEAEEIADRVLIFQADRGVVIKVDSPMPPVYFSEGVTIPSQQLSLILEATRYAYSKAGYVAVKPLWIDTE